MSTRQSWDPELRIFFEENLIMFGKNIIRLFFSHTLAFFVRIEVFGKNVRFLNISENTKENLFNFPD